MNIRDNKGRFNSNCKDEFNPSWKGSEVKYTALHDWIIKRKPKINKCEHCNKIKRLDLANISQKYYRDINDFLWLCKSCHRKMDWKLTKKLKLAFKKVKPKLMRNSKKYRFKKGDVPWNKGISINNGKNNPFYGKKHSDKTKKKLSKLAKEFHKRKKLKIKSRRLKYERE